MEATIYDSENQTWISPKSQAIFEKSTSVGLIALTMMRAQPAERICQISVDEHTKLSYGEACQRAIKLAIFLKNHAINEQDVIGIMSPNTTNLMPLILGCWLNCTPIQIISTLYDEATVQHVFGITKPKLIFCDGAHYELLKQSVKDLKTEIYTIRNHVEGVPKLDEIFETTAMSPLFKPVPLKHAEQTMAFYCTSGTTGKPKCVRSSNSSCLGYAAFAGSTTIMYSTAGPAWGSALIGVNFNMLLGSKRIITAETPSMADLIEIVKKYDVTFLGATPMEFAQLTQQHSDKFNKTYLPSLQFFITAGSSSTTATLQRFRALMPGTMLMLCYGSTEIGGVAFNSERFEMGVLGSLAPNLKLRIVDPVTKKSCGYNETGEICVWRAQKWSGYVGNEAATREVLDADGWLHSGDMGFMDETNILHFVDRYKDVLKYKGYQYSPNEIEEVISELQQQVEDVCVFGVFDEQFGDLAAAAVVRAKNASISEAEIVAHVAKRLVAEHKCLNYGVFFVEKIFRNANGKILRNQMRDFCLDKLEKK